MLFVFVINTIAKEGCGKLLNIIYNSPSAVRILATHIMLAPQLALAIIL